MHGRARGVRRGTVADNVPPPPWPFSASRLFQPRWPLGSPAPLRTFHFPLKEFPTLGPSQGRGPEMAGGARGSRQALASAPTGCRGPRPPRPAPRPLAGPPPRPLRSPRPGESGPRVLRPARRRRGKPRGAAAGPRAGRVAIARWIPRAGRESSEGCPREYVGRATRRPLPESGRVPLRNLAGGGQLKKCTSSRKFSMHVAAVQLDDCLRRSPLEAL